MIGLIEHLFSKPQTAVHARNEQSRGGGGAGVLPGAAVSKTTRPRLQEEGTVHCVLEVRTNGTLQDTNHFTLYLCKF